MDNNKNKILSGKIISRQIEIFHEGMKVAYWQDGLFGRYGWVTGILIGLPRLQSNGEILALIKWQEGKIVHCQSSVFDLKQFCLSYEPIYDTPASIFESALKKYIPKSIDSKGNELPDNLALLPLADSQWESVIENNQVDRDITLDFKIEQIPDYDKNFIVYDMLMKNIAQLC